MKLAIAGICGRMGKRILNLALKDEEFKVIGGVEISSHPEIGKEIEGGVKVFADLKEIVHELEVLIEFTNPRATLEHLEIISQAKKRMVIGTTGFQEEEKQKLESLGKDIPLVIAPNMSLGVNLLFKLAQEVGTVLSDYDLEIVEVHHNQKKDAPSGTALKLAELVSKARGKDLEEVGVYGRKGEGKRKKGEIGIFALRAGDIVGEHTLIFATQGERIELVHRAHSRDTFAQGALRAAKWLVKQKKGIYSMQDVLGI